MSPRQLHHGSGRVHFTFFMAVDDDGDDTVHALVCTSVSTVLGSVVGTCVVSVQLGRAC